MLIAHAPMGYIIAKKQKVEKKSLAAASILFSVLPDFDLLYYYIFDDGKRSHHLYFPHLPIVMFGSFLILLPFMQFRPMKKFRPYISLFYINWLVHLLLDTVTGGIAWLYPLKNTLIKLIQIPAHMSHWILSFVFHYSFLIEIGIVFYAFLLWKKSR